MTRLRPSRRGLRRLLTALLGVFVLVLVASPRPAAAHAELVTTEPTAGAVLEDPPPALVLTFTEPVDAAGDAVRLYDGAGTELPLEALVHDGSRLTVPLPVLQRGSYVVSWQVVSTDSHPISGAFIFQIGSASTLEPDVLEGVAASTATDGGAESLLGITRGLVIAAMALVGGGLAAVALGVVPMGRSHRAVVVAASIVGGAAGLVAIPLQSGFVTGRGAGAVTDLDAWRSVLETRLGFAWFARALVLYFGGIALAVTASRARERWYGAAVAVVLVVLGATTAYGGHGSSGRWPALGTAVTVVHVVAMAVWIGGLVAVVLGLREATEAGLRRFSSVAFVAAVWLVATGVVQSARQLERGGALFDTDYGRLLLAKVAAVVVVLGFAAAGRSAVGASRRRVAPAVSAGAAAADEPEVDRVTLGRSIRAELLFAAAVVVITASLTGTNPNEAAAAEPFSTTVVSQDYLASIAIDPAQVGPNQIHLYLSSPGGSLSRPDSVKLTIAAPDRDVAPIPIDVFSAGANHYQALAANFPFEGTWQLEIRAVYDTFDEIVFTAEVPVG